MLDRAEQMMRDMGAAAWFIIDTDEEFSFAKGADTNGDVYNNLIRVCKEASSLLICGAQLGQDTLNGNRSKEESSQKLFDKIIQADRTRVQGYWNEIILPALVRIGIVPAGLTYEYQQEEDLEKLWNQTHQAMQYFHVEPEWIRTKFGIEVTGEKGDRRALRAPLRPVTVFFRLSPADYYAGLHSALDDLYGDTLRPVTLAGTSAPRRFRAAVFERAARWLHARGEFSPDMMEEKPAADMVRETYRIVREAMDKGVADNVIPAAMARKLDNSAFLFSGFKTAQELKEASLLLREKDGTVKGFSRFLTDIRRIDANYNVRYLEAEYNFAVSSAQMAASWAEVSQDGDRYDLQYRTAGDDHVREEHRALNGVTLPPSNDFWRYYYPPNGWNCRCTAVQVRKGKYPTSDAGQAMEAGRRTTDTPKNVFSVSTPGIDGQLFPAKTPILQT